MTDARIITDPIGQSRGYGFVTYEDEEDASKVLSMNEDELVFKETKVSVAQAFRNQRNDHQQQRSHHHYNNQSTGQFNSNGGYYRPINAYRNNEAFKNNETFGNNMDMYSNVDTFAPPMDSMSHQQQSNMRFAYDQQYTSMDDRFFKN